MFRRIELISQMTVPDYRAMIQSMKASGEPIDKTLTRFWKSGLIGYGNETVMSTWVHLNMPRRRLFKNCRFYFTEMGWKRYGRPTVAACQQTDQLYRIIAIKEKSGEVVYRDEFQVAVRPKKKV